MPIPEQPLPTDQTEELHKRFAQTREFKLWLQLVEAIKALSDSTAERVDLPTGFLRIATADLENNPFSFPIRCAMSVLIGLRPWQISLMVLRPTPTRSATCP